MKRLLSVLSAVLIFSLFSCSPRIRSKSYNDQNLRTLDIGEIILNSEERLFLQGEKLIRNKESDCYSWIEFYGSYNERNKYIVVSDVLRVSPYGIFDSKYKRLYLENGKIIRDIGRNKIINYNPECKK